MGSDERAIREMHTAWIDAVNAGGLDRLLALMTDDVVFLNPGRSAFGRDGFSANFSAAHRLLSFCVVNRLGHIGRAMHAGQWRYRHAMFPRHADLERLERCSEAFEKRVND